MPNPNIITNRMLVDQWMARHRPCTATFSFKEDGLEHDRRYICIYILANTTPIEGSWKRSKNDAKESAAAEAIKILRIWDPLVC